MSERTHCIASRAWILLLTIVTILCLGIFSTWYSNASVRSATETLADRDYTYQIKVLDLRFHIVQVQQWLTDISATRGQDGLDDGYSEAEKHVAIAHRLIDEASALDPGNTDFFREMREIFDNYYATGKQMAALYVASGPAGGNPFMARFDEAAASMTESLDIVMQRAADRASATLDDIGRSSSEAAFVSLGTSLLTMLMLVVGLVYLIHLIKPLSNIRNATVQLSQNNLTVDLEPVKGRHEIAILASSFGLMKDNLKRAIGEISDVASVVSQTTSDMTQVADLTHHGVSTQNQQIEQIATAINEMAMTVKEISRSTAAAAESSQQANDAVNVGGEVIEEAVSASRKLAEEVANGADAVSRLQSEAVSIDKVLDVIRGIAEQTNLLALNAAIEAARAGEQGRGFAVVADEVRALASKTQDSTAEIQRMIERLQEGSTVAASVMGHSRETADRSARLATDAGQSLIEIRKAVSLIKEMSIQIATAAEQQGATANEINQSIEGIRQISQQTAGAAQQTRQASDKLNAQATTLRQFVTRFTV